MSADFVVAKRYAKALMVLSSTDTEHQVRLQTLQSLVSCFVSTNIFSLIENPLFDRTKQEQLIESIFSSLENKDNELKKFINLLIQERRLLLLSRIVDVYEKLLDEKLNICRVRLTVIDENKVSSKIEELLSDIKKQTGKELKITTQQDPSILGGAVIELEDTRIDLSVKRELNKIILHASR